MRRFFGAIDSKFHPSLVAFFGGLSQALALVDPKGQLQGSSCLTAFVLAQSKVNLPNLLLKSRKPTINMTNSVFTAVAQKTETIPKRPGVVGSENEDPRNCAFTEGTSICLSQNQKSYLGWL